MTIEKIEDGMELFIFQSGVPFADLEKLVQSFAHSGTTQVTLVTPGTKVHEIRTVFAWYGVFYDNEMIDDNLRASLQTFLEYPHFDVLCMWKKMENGCFSKTPRIFRRNVSLQENSLVPLDSGSLKSTNILDGWLLDQAMNG